MVDDPPSRVDRSALTGPQRLETIVKKHGANSQAHTFVVLEVEPFTDEEQKMKQPPFDGPELKFRFGRHLESRTGASVFGYKI